LRAARCVAGAGPALALLLLGLPTAAQDHVFGPGGGGIAPMGRPPPSQAPPQQAPSDAPETHAAPGGADSTLPQGNEPTLPEDPLEMSEETRARIGSDGDPATFGTVGDTERQFYGLYYNEVAGEYRYRVAFPVWAERTKPSLTDPTVPDRASLFGGLYYNRRSAERADDVLFPLVWNLRDRISDDRTTVVGPFVNRRAPEESDDWLAPLYMTGRRPGGGYTIIPPLLTALTSHAEGGFNLIGPGFCSWKGGNRCDVRTATDIDVGVAPLYFFGQDAGSQYEVIPPLLHYYRYRERDLSWLNIWGPYYREHTEKREIFHLLPFYWSIWGKDERHTTVAPFFHYGHKGDRENLLITPLFMNRTGPAGERTFATWGYARHRGRTELDMITPLFWHYRDPDIGLDQKLLFPFLYTRTSPREDTTAFLPFWAHSKRHGISRSLWITPFFNHRTHLRGWSTSILPLFFVGRDGSDTHLVVPPVFWDFASPRSRATVAFPVYWRFSDEESVTQLVGNVYYREQRQRAGLDWQLHVFPFFSYGETPDGHWWDVLYGLAGYSRRGTATSVKTLWIPIPLSD
jgi:hypothetical protein